MSRSLTYAQIRRDNVHTKRRSAAEADRAFKDLVRAHGGPFNKEETRILKKQLRNAVVG